MLPMSKPLQQQEGKNNKKHGSRCILTLRDLWLVLRSVDNNQRLNAEWCLLMPMQFRCLAYA